jgi:hypothetical protein
VKAKDEPAPVGNKTCKYCGKTGVNGRHEHLCGKNPERDSPKAKVGGSTKKTKDEPVKKDCKCRYCGRKLTSEGRVHQHEPVCTKNPNRNGGPCDPQSEGVPCPVDGCTANIKNKRWNVVSHLSRVHPEIDKRDRAAMIDKMFPESVSTDIEDLKEEFEHLNDPAGVKDLGDRVKAHMDEAVAALPPEAQAVVKEITDIAKDVIDHGLDALTDPDPPAAPPIEELVLPNTIHRETVVIPAPEPVPEPEGEYVIHDEDDDVIRKDLEEHAGIILVVKRSSPPSIFETLSQELVRLSGMVKSQGYKVEDMDIHENNGLVQIKFRAQKVVQ